MGSGEDSGYKTRIISTRIDKTIRVDHVNYFHANFPRTELGLFSVLSITPCVVVGQGGE